MRIIHFVLILCCIHACSPSDTIEQEALYGRWDIIKAERNGKETNYLRRGYFNIGQDGMMTINITVEDERGKYLLEKGKIKMEDDKIFELESLQGDSLIVKYIAASNGHFKFYMVKKNDNAQ
ncbi:MAG: hypothetical protein ABIQ11_06740 [Saprospiraceae bacterium]